MNQEPMEYLGGISQIAEEGVTLFSISMGEGWRVEIEAHVIFWIGAIALLVVPTLWGWRKLAFRSYEIDAAEIGVGNNKISIRPNTVDSQIAYRIWVELSTRKLGLPIDDENDVISEVYDSWYGFFSVARGLIGDIPATKLRRKDTKSIVNLSIDVLNLGLRPHLTRWQAKYRNWFESRVELGENQSKSPQEIQREYPEYQLLMADLKQVNKRIILYRDHMYRLAVGDLITYRRQGID